MLDYRLYTFLEVCKNMNYTRAAESLNITQPNVSQHIRWIEEYYQVQLFVYSQRKLTLTPEGEEIYRVAKAVAHEEHLLLQKLNALKMPDARLAFGITRSINEGPMKRRVIRMLEEYCPNHLKMSVDNTEHLLEQLQSEQLDFAIVEGNFSSELFDSIILSKEKFIPVCRSRAFGEKKLRLEELRGERLIIREDGSGSRKILESILESRNMSSCDFAAVMEIGDIETIKLLVSEGYGISFLYESAVEDELRSGQIERLPMEDLDVQHDFCLIWLKTASYRSVYEKIAIALKKVIDN